MEKEGDKEIQKQKGKKKPSVAGFMRDNYLCALTLGWQDALNSA